MGAQDNKMNQGYGSSNPNQSQQKPQGSQDQNRDKSATPNQPKAADRKQYGN